MCLLELLMMDINKFNKTVTAMTEREYRVFIKGISLMIGLDTIRVHHEVQELLEDYKDKAC